MPSAKKAATRRAAARVGGAEQQAAALLSQFGFTAAPIPVELVARRLGLEIERTVLGEEISGLLVVKGGRGMIGVNLHQPKARQRFTIAHECGHFVLHRQKLPVFIDKQFLQPYFRAYRDSSSSTGEDRMEREANSFAAALLMPERLVHAAITALPADIADDEAVELLSKQFQVSRQAMAFRLANLASSINETRR
jgi:Zn-dependent peptidase ImmA (M78 family)